MYVTTHTGNNNSDIKVKGLQGLLSHIKGLEVDNTELISKGEL